MLVSLFYSLKYHTPQAAHLVEFPALLARAESLSFRHQEQLALPGLDWQEQLALPGLDWQEQLVLPGLDWQEQLALLDLGLAERRPMLHSQNRP